MKRQIVVIGGGFVGQLVQLAIPEAHILDWRLSPPADHLETRVGPQYLHEPIPGVKSSSFRVLTYVDGDHPNENSILRYKRKIGKEFDGGDWDAQFQHEQTGWTSHLPVPRVQYGWIVRSVDLSKRKLAATRDGLSAIIDYDVLISTIPLYSLLDMLWPKIPCGPFKYDPIYMSIQESVGDIQDMILDYQSNPTDPCYRITNHRTLTFRESIQSSPMSKRIAPGKIHSHIDRMRIMTSLAMGLCFCFGRFATWRPDELAHESWHDIISWKEQMAL